MYIEGKGFWRTLTDETPFIAADGKEEKEGRYPTLLTSRLFMSGSTLGDGGGTQMFCPTQAILSVVKPPGSREGHISQKDCGP